MRGLYIPFETIGGYVKNAKPNGGKVKFAQNIIANFSVKKMLTYRDNIITSNIKNTSKDDVKMQSSPSHDRRIK